MVEKRIHRLRDLAQRQYGYFTAEQANQVGVSSAYLANLVRTGKFAGVSHGVYVDPTVPIDRFDRSRRALLWTGRNQACLSHQTALWLWDLADEPEKIDLTLPRGTRIRRAGGETYTIHSFDLPKDWVTEKYDVRTVDAAVAIVQSWREMQISGDRARKLTYAAFEGGVISEQDRNELYSAFN